MLKFKVFKTTPETMTEETFEFEAEGMATETNFTLYPFFYTNLTLSGAARDLIALQKSLAQQKVFHPLKGNLVVEFLQFIEIYHPLNGISRVRFPLSKEEIMEFWRYLREWRDAHGDSCEA